MRKDIEILENFLAYDKNHLDDLYLDLPYTLNLINQNLHEKVKSFYLVHGNRQGDDPILELIDLLDDNNFIVIDDPDHQIAQVIPLYPEGSE